MLAIHEEVSRAAQERVSWQLAVGNMLGDTLVQGLRQVAHLNVSMLRANLEQFNVAVRQLTSARDAKQFMSLAAAQMAPGASRGFDYGYYLVTIHAGMQGSAAKAFAGLPEMDHEWRRLADHLSEPYGWRFMFSLAKEIAESVFSFPADVARATRLALNVNVPAWESGKLHIVHSGPGPSFSQADT